jgi:hypothetical protein
MALGVQGVRRRHAPRLRSILSILLILIAASALVGLPGWTSGLPPAMAAETPASIAEGKPASWLETLLARAGDEPVLLMRQADGTVLARTPSGRIKQTLVSGSPREILFDAALDLLWLRAAERLDVVDLRANVPAAVPIARDLPANARVTISAYWSGHPASVYPRTNCEVDSLISVNWLETPKLSFEGGKKSRKVRLVGNAWLQANYERVAEAAPLFVDFEHNGESPLVKLPASVARCEPGSVCGKWMPFGSSGRRIVLAGSKTSERCRSYSCLLFDPKAQTFSSPNEPEKGSKADQAVPGSCGPMYFDRAGQHYLLGNKLCSMREGCRDLAGESIGWLRPGQSLGPEG